MAVTVKTEINIVTKLDHLGSSLVPTSVTTASKQQSKISKVQKLDRAVQKKLSDNNVRLGRIVDSFRSQ